MIILPSRNGMLLRNSNGILAADCGGPTAACDSFPQYINAVTSGITISGVGHYSALLRNNTYGIWPYDTNSSLYNTNYSIGFSYDYNGKCYYELLGNVNVNVIDRSTCGTETYRGTACLCSIAFDPSGLEISLDIGNISSGNGRVSAFREIKNLTQLEWDTMISNRTVTFSSNVRRLGSSYTVCSTTLIKVLSHGENWVTSGGTCVLSW